MPQQNSSVANDREGSLITENFGGLNTESAPNDLPDGDSPNMMNVEVNTNGLLVKRRGTNWRQRHTTAGYRSGRGHTLMPHKLKKGHIVVCEKLQTGLRWGMATTPAGASNFRTAGGLISIGLMPFVFSSRAADSRASWVVTPDPIPRLIIATGENAVVEVSLYEQLITTTGSSIGTMVITDDVLPFTRFNVTTGTTFVVLISDAGVLTPVTSTSKVGTAVTLNFSGTLAAGNYTVFRPVWRYWMESDILSPDQLYDFVVNPATASANGGFPALALEIPEPLRRGVTPFNVNGDRPYTMYDNNLGAPTINAWDPTDPQIQRLPATGALHVYSSGAGVNRADEYINSGDTHVVFCPIGINEPAKIKHIVRAYRNNFLDGANQLRAREIDAVQNPFSTSGRTILADIYSDGGSPAVATNYWFGAASELYYRGYTTTFGFTLGAGSAATMGAIRLGFYSMSGSFPFGINDGSFSWTRATDIGATAYSHIGTDRGTTTDLYGTATTKALPGAADSDFQGKYTPVAGLGEICNYNNTGTYDFPSIVAYYQGRIVLSGFKNSPNLVAMSNVTNNYEWVTSVPDTEVNKNFSVLYTDVGLGFSPIHIFLDVDTSERVTNIVATNDALVCFTQNNTVAITGVNGSNVIPTAYVQNRVSKVGCLNFKCAVNTELGIIFLSRSGVYFLKPVQETGSYQTVSLSLKIQRVIDQSTMKNENVAWMAYDQAKSTVYLGLSDGLFDTCCARLMVLNVLRNAWTEYGLTGGYWMSNDGAYIDSRMFVDFNIWNDRVSASDNASNSVNVLELYGNHFVDWAFLDLGNAFTGAYTLPIPNHTLYFSLDTAQRNYTTTLATVPTSCAAVRPIPLRTVLENDYVNTTSVTRYNDWISITGATGGTNQSSELTVDFTNLQIEKTPMEGFVIADSVAYSTGNVLRLRLREYNALFDTQVPVHIQIDTVELAQTGTPRFDIGDAAGTLNWTATPTASYTSSQFVFFGASIPCWWFSPVYDRQQNNKLKRITHVTTQFRNRDNQLYDVNDRNFASGQAASAVADRFVFESNANIAILYDNTFDTTYQMDLYQLTDNLYTFGTDMNKARRDPYTRVVSPVIGSSFSLQMCVFSFDNSYFELSAYQMVTKPKGRSSRSGQDLR